MGFARTCSVALIGVEGVVVEVQADLEPGVAAFALVGLPDKSLVESRDRVRAAIVNSGETWPQKKLTVGLSPASVPKGGSGFDLAVACAVLAASGRIAPSAIADLMMIGELGLDGRVRPVRGVLPAVLAAADAGYRQVVVPERTTSEAALVPGVSVLGVRSLRQLVAVLNDEAVPEEPDESAGRERPDPMLAGLAVPGGGAGAGLGAGGGPGAFAGTGFGGGGFGSAEFAAAGGGGPGADQHRPDLADVAGQRAARLALEVAAAGGHHLYLNGPPGAGKTMLAERLPGILPPLTRQESLEVTAVHSVAGILPTGRPMVDAPPYCAPHHSATMPSLVGGGSGLPRPGAVSLAHRGVLFLDEAPEFSSQSLDALRQPLESGHVIVARAAGVIRLPARFMLVLAANPCPCGRYSVLGGGCDCSPSAVRRYQARLSGPLLDRVDLRVDVEPVSRAELIGPGGVGTPGEPSAAVGARVLEARARAAARYQDTPWRLNSEVPGHELRTRWHVAAGALRAVERDMERGLLTARGLDRVLRVAWTVADLAGADCPTPEHVLLALQLRTGVNRGVPAVTGGV
ncbi:YifB family Mg chelatase-like AAA ATPase [Streptomyces sp. NBC_00448]|uniref:YifB family Mg chelatase-like AAA ATPase n=1 Tax=Streptomyces sp. NBC_00448 TaxID=2903652 RepID=UPI002E236051